MNYLAHIYLSGSSEEILMGNIIGDFVKGSRYKHFPENIKAGILLHRFIDSYTDTHPLVRKSKSRFVPKFDKYSGVVVDIIYDFFLSIEWYKYSTVPLPDFIKHTTVTVQDNFSLLPSIVQELLPDFVSLRWLEAYGSIDGIEQVLRGMGEHTSMPDETEFAIDVINTHFDQFRSEFALFFPELIKYVSDRFGIVLAYEKMTKSKIERF